MSVTQHPVPFFTDTRSLSEKLSADEQEWSPHKPTHDCPAEIYGLVLELGQYFSTFRDSNGEYKVHTTARVLTEDNVVWSVIAFAGYLQSEFDRKKPRIGDFVAIAYKGTKPAKKPGESDANVYKMEVERNPTATLPGLDDAGSEDTSVPARETVEEATTSQGDEIPW